MEDFIAVGKDVNESDEEDRTPLHYAVAYNHAEIVDELIANGANLEVQVQLLCGSTSVYNVAFPKHAADSIGHCRITRVVEIPILLSQTCNRRIDQCKMT